MKTIIEKELREHGMWAVLLLAGMSIALAGSLYDPLSWHLAREGATIISSSCQVVVAFGAPIAALLLGFLQVIPELLRDQWSFLIHRPATRAELFGGKVIAGIILYSIAVVVPIAGAIAWTATPGHVAAPFEWRMAGIPLIDVLAGFTYYFAAQLTALRHARWYVTRTMPLVAAVLTSVAVVGLPGFAHALVAVLLAWAVLGSAAWGAFVASGEYPAQPRHAKFSLGLILAIGLFTAAVLAAAAVESAKPSPDYAWSQYFINHDGRVLIAHYDGRGRRTTITDRQGRPESEFADPERASQYYHHSLPLRQLLPGWEHQPNYRHTTWAYQQVRDDPREVWYFVPVHGRFEGFDIVTRRPIGWIGVNGFAFEKSRTKAFPPVHAMNLWPAGTNLITCAQSIYRVNWSDRSIETVFTASSGETVRGACEVRAHSPEGRSDESSALLGTAIALDSRIVLLDRANKPLFATPYHLDTSRYRYVQIAAAPQNHYILWYARLNSWPMNQSEIVELSSSGQELSRQSLPPLPQRLIPKTSRDEAVLMGGVPLSGYALMFVVGDVVDPFEGDKSWSQRTQAVWTAFKDSWAHQRSAMITALATFALCILVSLPLCEWIARRYAFSNGERWTWRMLSVLLGLITVPTLLSLRDWPARAACPSCSRLRRVDRDRCEHCGQTFPPSEIRRGDLFDAESVQGSNLPTPLVNLTGADAP